MFARAVHSVARPHVLVLLALGFAFALPMQTTGENQKAHLALVRALADGKAAIDESMRDADTRTIDATRIDGHWYAAKVPGLAFVSTPVFLVMRTGGYDPRDDQRDPIWILHLVGVVLPAIVLVALVRREADEVAPGLGVAAAVLLGTATLVLPFATLYFSHILSAALGFASYSALRRERSGLAGVLAGLAVVAEYTLVLLVAVVVVAAALRSRRAALAAAAGAVAGAAPALVFNWWALGSPFRVAYEGWKENATTELPGIFGITLPSARTAVHLLAGPSGIAALAIGLLGAVLLYRVGRRRAAALLAAPPLLFFLANAANTNPAGGASPGPRYFIPAIPFLVVGAAAALRRFPGLTLGVLVGPAVFFIAATVTFPLQAWDGRVTERLREREFAATLLERYRVADEVGAALFVGAILFAVVIAARASNLRVPRARDAAAFAAASAGWCLLAMTSDDLFSSDHGASAVTLALLATALVLVVIQAFPVGRVRPAQQ